MSTWNLGEKSQGDLKVTLEGDLWKSAQKKAYNKLAQNLEVDGFRKGQAPKAIVDQHIKKEHIYMEAIEELANEELQKGIKEYDLWPVARPQLSIDEVNEDKADINFIITVKPEVTLGEYKGLPYKEEDSTVSDEEIKKEITRLQENYADLVSVDKAAENGDTAVIDFEGFKDDVAFEGGKGENYPLALGSHSFIPGFEEQVVGMKKGDSKDIRVSFPEDYQAEDLKGQAVVFKVTCHDVQQKQLPELNDDFAKDLNIPDVSDVAGLQKLIGDELSKQKKSSNENKAMNDLIEKVSENAKVEIPDIMVDEEAEYEVREMANRLQQQGISLEQYSQITGQKPEDLKAQMMGDAEKKVRVRLILEAIAEKEGLKATDEDISKEYQSIADQYKMEVDEVKKMISSDSIGYDIQVKKALDLVKDSAQKQ